MPELRRVSRPERNPSSPGGKCAGVVGIERDREGAEEACGKLNFGCNAVLTIWRGLLILVSSLQATLLDRGVEQTLFDNLIDVPESVRPYSSPSSVNGDFE